MLVEKYVKNKNLNRVMNNFGQGSLEKKVIYAACKADSYYIFRAKHTRPISKEG